MGGALRQTGLLRICRPDQTLLSVIKIISINNIIFVIFITTKPGQFRNIVITIIIESAQPRKTFLVFSFRGPSARHFFFLVQNYPACPFASLATFWAEHAFSAFFSGLGTCNFVKHDDWDWSEPWALLSVPSPPLLGSRPLLAVSRSSWVASLLSSSHTWEVRMWSAVVGAQGTVAVCSRLSPPVPGPHGGRGRTCFTPPWACSVSRKSDATRTLVWQGTCRTRSVQGTWGADTHARKSTTH